jgi:hypothetical protein
MPCFAYPTDAKGILGKLVGRSIVRVRRYLLRSEYNELPAQTRDQESDGTTELQMDDGTLIQFDSHTESMSVQVSLGEMDARRERHLLADVSGNEFWAPMVGRKILAIDALVSKYASPVGKGEFAVVFELEGDWRFVIEYLSDEEHTDLIRVTGGLPTGEYDRVPVCSMTRDFHGH